METCYPTQAIGKKIGLVLKAGLWISTDIAGTKNRVLGISDLIQIIATSTNFKPNIFFKLYCFQGTIFDGAT